VPRCLACRLAPVTSDDHRQPTDGPSGDDVLLVSTTQALQTKGYFGAELVVTQHGTSGRMVKPANDPGLPLLDRNEQALSGYPSAGASRGLLVRSGGALEPVPIRRP